METKKTKNIDTILGTTKVPDGSLLDNLNEEINQENAKDISKASSKDNAQSGETSNDKKAVPVQKEVKVLAFNETQRVAIVKVTGYGKGQIVLFPLQVNVDFTFICNGEEEQIIEF